MNYLFFLVHPSKFHLFRFTINELIKKGHSVKILIISKDVLEDLVKAEGWDYHNIFPEGRKIKGLNPKISAVINTFRTLIRLNKYASKEMYDLYITDDLLTIIGRIKSVPTFLFQDDDITAVPESVLVLSTAKYILAPIFTNFKKYNKKKIGFIGFKSSAYLHPNHFTADPSILDKYNLNNKKYFVIRLVSLTATHDVGKKGLDDKDLDIIIDKLTPHGEVVISSQRHIPKKYEKFRANISPKDFFHIIAFADIFISDSQTMSMEAGYLGTPFIRFNDFVGKISYLDVMENEYGLGFGIMSREKDHLFKKIDELLAEPNLKSKWILKRNKMIEDTIDLSNFMIWLFENYPNSLKKLEQDPTYINEFK